MKRAVFLVLLALPALGADFEAGLRHVGVFAAGDSGALDIALSRGFAATGEVFWTERVSTQFAASFVNPEAILEPANAEPVDLGTLGLDVYSVTARYHFTPEARFSAFAGAGAAVVSIGNLDDQFGDDYEAEFESETTWLVEAGVRYRVLPRLFFDVGASYLPLGAQPERARGPVPAELNVDPVTVSIGAAWRF